MSQPDDITRILERASSGERGAVDELLPHVYDELRRLAESHLQRERPDHTLQATALVHEAYLKLVDQTRAEWRGRAHFFAVAAQAVRRILVDHARGKGRQKRGGGRRALTLDDALVFGEDDSTDLLDLDDALGRLAGEHPDKVRVVELRFFGGLTSDEAAEVLGVTTRTVERQWQFARAWLYREIAGGDTEAVQ
ncbi:MAG: ECF-type sigma factor [Planctomycetota bacterium]|jgi:RNA polymerase sigma factor (TIGR02999 family)